MGPIDLIRDAYNFLKDEDRFCQGYYQRDKEGKKCVLKDAYSCCALGTLNCLSYSASQHLKDFSSAYEPIADDISAEFAAVCLTQSVAHELYGTLIQTINDQPDRKKAHREVLHVWEVCLERWKDREPTREEIYWRS